VWPADMALHLGVSSSFSRPDAFNTGHFCWTQDPRKDMDNLAAPSRPPQARSIRPLSMQPPKFVEPQKLHFSQDLDGQERNSSLGSLSYTAATTSPVRSLLLKDDEVLNGSSGYRPRSSPQKKRKTNHRITPRSEKHARELELNRRAATKCRDRHKAFVENLQKKCQKEEERLQHQTSLVRALHDEVMALRHELLRRSSCGCQPLSNMNPSMT